MAALSYDCSLRQAFNFEKDSQVVMGHLNKISIGGTALKADLELTLPTDYSKVKKVGAISVISWTGGYSDPIRIVANISTDNQKTVSLMTHTDMVKTDVEVDFDVWSFDPADSAKKYYPCFTCSSTALKGLILKEGGSLRLSVSTEPHGQVPSPLNYTFEISIMPQATAQQIHVAVSDSMKFVKTYGVTNG